MMTRDEAVAKFLMTAVKHTCSVTMAGELVDAYVSLGMLKLDEPIDGFDAKLKEAVRWCDLREGQFLDFKNALDHAGLKIVES